MLAHLENSDRGKGGWQEIKDEEKEFKEHSWTAIEAK